MLTQGSIQRVWVWISGIISNLQSVVDAKFIHYNTKSDFKITHSNIAIIYSNISLDDGPAQEFGLLFPYLKQPVYEDYLIKKA